MYDTVNMWIDRVDISGENPFDVLPYLSDVTERQNKNGYSCTGTVLDYTVTVYEMGISLKGSLCKSFFGENLQTLTRRTVGRAIEKLGDYLHTDIGAARVTRLDVSTSIPTKRPPSDYYGYMGNKPYFERLQATNDTLYYNNRQRQMIFYNKAVEAKTKNVPIPAIFENTPLLRYELRYTKRINKQLKADVTASKLTDEVLYRGVIQNWYNEFKGIQKLKKQCFMTDGITTLKEAKEAFYAHLLQQAGQSIIDDYLNELKAQKRFNNRSDYTKLKTDLNRIMQAKREEQGDMIQELETSFFNIAKYAR